MKNKKLDELNIPSNSQPSLEEQHAILDDISNGLRENTESLRKMLSDLKKEFGE